jgi:hypothetical protein
MLAFKEYFQKLLKINFKFKVMMIFKSFLNFDRALAIEPTNKGVKAARHESKFKLGIEKRFEHLDERSSPQTIEQFLEKVNKNGLRVRPEIFNNMDKIVD